MSSPFPFVPASDSGELVVGEFVEYEGRPWRVGLTNFTRARLDPVVNGEVKEPSDEATKSVNVGPASTLRRLTPEEAVHFNRNTRQESSTMDTSTAVADMPIADTKRSKKTAAKARTRKATGSIATSPKAKRKTAAPKREPAVADKPCKCGCGEKTSKHFVPGHDARFKGLLLAIERGKVKKEDVLKKAVISAYSWKKKGKGEIPTTNYKGEKHTGYDEE